MKFFVSAMLAVMSVTAVQAHEVYSAPCPTSSYCCPCDGGSFDGWYFGGNVGWAIQDHTWVDRDAWVDNFSNDWALGSVCGSNDGVTAGIQGGYNWQCGCALLGIEADANWADLESNKRFSPVAVPGTVLSLSDKMEWFGTIRGRAGIVADNLLIYTTLGAAFANLKHKWTINDATIPAVESFSENSWRWGLAVGAGAEWAFCNNLSLKAEALYLKFPERSKTVTSAAGVQDVHFDLLDDAWVARVGLNFKLCYFNSCF